MVRFEEIHAEADKAGREAAREADLDIVRAVDSLGNVSAPFPICGFGWVQFAGNTAWGRWAKSVGLARNAYPKGLSIWVNAYEQSYDKKLAYARGYAEVLTSHGISAMGLGRLD